MEVLTNQYHHHHHHAEHAKPAAASYEKLFTSESVISSRNVDTHRFDDSSNISMQQSQQQMQSSQGDESQQVVGKKKRNSQSLLAEHKNLLLQSTGGDKSDKILFEPGSKAKLNIKIKESLTTNTNSKSNKTEAKSKKETKKSEIGPAVPVIQASIQPSSTSPLIIQQKITTTIDKDKKQVKKTKKKKAKKSNSGTSSNGGNTNADDQGAGDSMGEETGLEKDSVTTAQQVTSKIESSENDWRNNESVRWENEVSDENDELKRLEVYKQNRRKRYMEEQNKSKQTKIKETVIVEDLESPSNKSNGTLSASLSFRKTSARLLNRNLIDINYELDELKLSAVTAQSNNNNANPIITEETHVIESISNLRRPSLSSNNKKLTDSAVSSMSSNSNKF